MDESGEALKPDQNQKEGIETILLQMDKALAGKEGIMPLTAWRYREEVRAKYQLPECGYRWNDPARFINEIEAFIKKEGIIIRPKHDFERFFSEHPKAQAVTLGKPFRETTVVVSESSQGDWFGLRKKANQLAHEAVHALQAKRYPEMPDEVAEKEAFYYQMLNPQTIERYKDDPDFLHDFINRVIEDSIKLSCKIDSQI